MYHGEVTVTVVFISDLGLCIFWDLLQLIAPTHVIHLRGDSTEIEPINATNFPHSLGWLLLAPPNSCDQPHPQIEETFSQNSDHERQIGSLGTVEHLTDELANECSDCTEGITTEASHVNTKKNKRKLCKRLKFKRLLNKRKAISKKFVYRAKLRADLSKGLLRAARQKYSRHSEALKDAGWKNCGLFQLFSHFTNPYSPQIR